LAPAVLKFFTQSTPLELKNIAVMMIKIFNSYISYVIDASRGVPKVITDGTHAPPISVKIVGEPHWHNSTREENVFV
jgi:hypothetical protein